MDKEISLENIDNYIPKNPGWNYVFNYEHPEDKPTNLNLCGKWLLFVPHKDFKEVFKILGKLTLKNQLTHQFKASGTPSPENFHVFCLYCSNYRKYKFIEKIGVLLKAIGFIDKYGSGKTNKYIYFKTDNATRVESNGQGLKLTLYKFSSKGYLHNRIYNSSAQWKRLDKNSIEGDILKYENYLIDLKNKIPTNE